MFTGRSCDASVRTWGSVNVRTGSRSHVPPGSRFHTNVGTRRRPSVVTPKNLIVSGWGARASGPCDMRWLRGRGPCSPTRNVRVFRSQYTRWVKDRTDLSVPKLERRPPQRFTNVVKPSTVSTGKLRASQPLHIRPINLVVYQGSSAHPKGAPSPHLGDGFTLRCIQRLSNPCLATQPCR